MLYGSSVLPSMVDLGDDGYLYQLGHIVRCAFVRSKLTVDQWNAEPQRLRELRLSLEIEDLTALFRG